MFVETVRVVGVRDWRFNQHIEDIEWLLKLSAADGSATTGVCAQGLCSADTRHGELHFPGAALAAVAILVGLMH